MRLLWFVLLGIFVCSCFAAKKDHLPVKKVDDLEDDLMFGTWLVKLYVTARKARNF